MSKTAFMVLDVETGGLNPLTDAILSIALLVTLPDGSTMETSMFIYDVGGALHQGALDFNGIDARSKEFAGKAHLPRAVVEVLQTFLADVEKVCVQQGCQLFTVAQNPCFDTGFVRRLFDLAGSSVPKLLSGYRMLDTHTIGWLLAHTRLTCAENGGLDASIKALSVEKVSDEQRHTALGDCIQTQRVLDAQIRRVEGALAPAESAGDLLRRHVTRVTALAEWLTYFTWQQADGTINWSRTHTRSEGLPLHPEELAMLAPEEETPSPRLSLVHLGALTCVAAQGALDVDTHKHAEWLEANNYLEYSRHGNGFAVTKRGAEALHDAHEGGVNPLQVGPITIEDAHLTLVRIAEGKAIDNTYVPFAAWLVANGYAMWGRRRYRSDKQRVPTEKGVQALKARGMRGEDATYLIVRYDWVY